MRSRTSEPIIFLFLSHTGLSLLAFSSGRGANRIALFTAAAPRFAAPVPAVSHCSRSARTSCTVASDRAARFACARSKEPDDGSPASGGAEWDLMVTTKSTIGKAVSAQMPAKGIDRSRG